MGTAGHLKGEAGINPCIWALARTYPLTGERKIPLRNEEKEVFISGGIRSTKFELNREHKHYRAHVSCKRMLVIDGCPIEVYERTHGQQTGVDIIGHKLEISGRCPDCKAKIEQVKEGVHENEN